MAHAHVMMELGHRVVALGTVGHEERCTLGLVDDLALLQRAARRLGWSIRLSHASAELDELLQLVGLADLLPHRPPATRAADEFGKLTTSTPPRTHRSIGDPAMSFHPYLFFSSGQCAEAFRCYHEILGGKLQVMTNAELPEGEEPMPGAEPHHVMHASIELGGGFLMGSDDPTGDGGPKVGVAVTYAAPDAAEGKRVFEALSEGGQVFMGFEPTFFSKGFGACIDRFGVNWMVDAQGEPDS